MAVDSDRHSCLACLSTMVRNTADCQPLYDDVLSLYASFGMALPTRPPLLLVRLCKLHDRLVFGHSPRVHAIGTGGRLCADIGRHIVKSLGICMFVSHHTAAVGQGNEVQRCTWCRWRAQH